MRAGTKAALLVAVCLGLAAISLTLRVSVGEGDPWGWLVWGYELPRGPLDTSAGPAWKPLPVVFTTPFSLFGDAAPTLWLLLTRTAWLLGLAGGYRLASRLGGSSAGVLAVLALASIAQAGEGWFADFLSGRSEMLAVPAALWAINRHLDGHRGQALLLGLVPVLDRPVAWPFMLVYAGYLWRSEPRHRPLVASVVALGPLLWFGGDLLASGDPLATASQAQGRPLAAPSLGLVIGELELEGGRAADGSDMGVCAPGARVARVRGGPPRAAGPERAGLAVGRSPGLGGDRDGNGLHRLPGHAPIHAARHRRAVGAGGGGCGQGGAAPSRAGGRGRPRRRRSQE